MEGSEIWFSFRRIWISIPPDFDFVPTGFDFVPTDFEFLPPVLGGWKGAWRGPASALRCWEESAKALSQYGFARKSLKSPNSRKKKAWNLLPLALNFLPTDLDFPSRGFGNPSAPHRAALSRLRRALTKARRPRRGTSRC